MSSAASPLSDAAIFSPPLGYRNGIGYGPRYTYDNGGALIENTDYGVQNPDLSHYSNCFAIDMRYLLHAGEDWYRLDGSAANGDEVTAIADGTVYDYDSGWDYPGEAVVLEHILPSGIHVYSVYMHIVDVPPEIANGQAVSRGQRIGTVLQQDYDGRYPEHHGTDDSHLHFEVRYFASANGIYSDHPACNKGDAAGRGYTYPGYLPDTYPNSNEHYTDPATFVQSRSGAFLPLVIKQEPSCNQGSALIANGNFEQGRVYWIEQGSTIIRTDTPYKHGGLWAAWLAGYDNANDMLYQSFHVPNGATSASLVYHVRMGTDETSSGGYDYLRVHLRNAAGSVLSTMDVLNDDSTQDTWLRRSFTIADLGSYAGQTLRISFDVMTNGALTTNFYVDDVTLTLNCTGSLTQEGSEAEAEPAQPVGGGYPAVQPRKPTSTPHVHP
jgi:hypothetical protein